MKGRFCIAIACAGGLALPAAAARAQTTFRETGSVTVGGYVLWVRGTSASAVELFIGRGFRDAFAPAHEMDAVKLQHWIDSVRTLAPLPADDSTALSASAKAAIAGGDVAMQRRVGGLFAGLRLIVSGEEPIQMAEPTARDLIAALDSAAHVARELSGPAVQTVASVSAPAPTPVAAAPVASAPVASAPVASAPVASAPVASAPVVPAPVAPAPVAPQQQAAVPKVTSTPSPSAPEAPAPVTMSTATVITAPSAALPATPLAASTSEPPPELVLPAPSAPVLLLASRVDISPLPMPPVVPPARVPVRVAVATIDSTVATALTSMPANAPDAAPLVAAATASAPPPPTTAPIVAKPVAIAPADAPAVAPPVAAAPAPVLAPVLAPAPLPVSDTGVAPHPEPQADKLIHTPLGPFTIPAALLSDRDKEAQYCYTQLGLKYNPDLKGEITVKVSLGSDGTVQDAVVTKRSWQGISAGEVESCVRALAHDWTFASTDAGVVAGAKLLTFSFAP